MQQKPKGFNSVVLFVPAEGLILPDARMFAVNEVARFAPRLYKEPAIEG